MSLVPLLRNNVFDPNNLEEFEKMDRNKRVWMELVQFMKTDINFYENNSRHCKKCI